MYLEKPKTAMIPSKMLDHCKKQSSPDVKFTHAMGQFIDMEGGHDFHASEFLNHINLSAHFLIDPSGTIIEMLPMDRQGAHAKGHNYKTVGIEWLVPGLHTYGSLMKTLESELWVTPQAFNAGVSLYSWLEANGVMGWARHDETDPGRKFDPGPKFPYKELKERVNQIVCG